MYLLNEKKNQPGRHQVYHDTVLVLNIVLYCFPVIFVHTLSTPEKFPARGYNYISMGLLYISNLGHEINLNDFTAA